jgi:AbrB family looped-hinge helix DNA binding protein
MASDGLRFQNIRIQNSEFMELPMRTASLEVRDRGQVTLPKALRDALQLEEGDAVRAVQIGDSIVLTPQRMELDALRREIRRLMKKHNVTADDLLRDL